MADRFDPWGRKAAGERRRKWEAPGGADIRWWHIALAVLLGGGIALLVPVWTAPQPAEQSIEAPAGPIYRPDARIGPRAESPLPVAPPRDRNEQVPAQPDAVSARFGLCSFGQGRNCVIDGDTFLVGGMRVRIADIDTPELSPSRCAEEERLGRAAKARLRELLNQGPFELAQVGDRDVDQHGRQLRVVVRNGQSIGDRLVAEGLARTWTGRREPWC